MIFSSLCLKERAKRGRRGETYLPPQILQVNRFLLYGISILSWNKQLHALGHASLRQSASVPGTGLWLRGLNLSGLFESDHQEVSEAEERRGKGFGFVFVFLQNCQVRAKNY